MNKFSRQKGFSQIILLVIISFLAISLPIATKLVQKSQENRSSAATKTVYDCLKGSSQGVRTVGTYDSSGACSSACSGGVCKSRTITVNDPTPPKCSYTYSAWGACSEDGIQNRNITSRSPDGCTGGSPILTQTCDPKTTDGTKVAGRCGNGIDRCETGTFAQLDDADSYYKWNCGITVCTWTKQNVVCDGNTDRSVGCACTANSQCASRTCDDKVCIAAGYTACGSVNQTFTTAMPGGTSACKSDASLTGSSDSVGSDGDFNWSCVSNTTHKVYSCSAKNSNATKCGVSRNACVKDAKLTKLDDSDFYHLWKCDNETCMLAKTATGGCLDVWGGFKIYVNGATFCKGDTSYYCNNGKLGSLKCSDGCFGGECRCSVNGKVYDSGKSYCKSTSVSSTCNFGSFVDKTCPTNVECSSTTGTCGGSVDLGCTQEQEGKFKCSDDGKSSITCVKEDSKFVWKTEVCASGTCVDGACTSTDGGGGGPYDPPVVTPSVSPTPTGIGATGAKLSFKIAFDGVAQTADFTCLNNFKTVKLVVGKVGSSLTEEKTVDITKTTGVGSESSKKYVIFEANNVVLGAGFSGATNVYARIKGQVHASMYYCTKGQSAKNTSQVCNLALDGTVNNFYEYPVLGGDVNQDGKVDTTDFSVIKNDLNKVGCEYKSDLNGDGKVNGPDIKIHKTALESKYDE